MKRSSLALLWLLACSTARPPPADPPSPRGNAWARCNGVETCAAACERSGGEPCSRLRFMLFEFGGLVQTPRAERAREVLERACDEHDPSACAAVGMFHCAPEGVGPWSACDDTAMASFRASCEGKDAQGCALLGFA